MQQECLFPRIRKNVQNILNGYVKNPAILDKIEEYIVAPKLGSKAGVLGAIALARQTSD